MPHPGTKTRAILEFKPLTDKEISRVEKAKGNTLVVNRLVASVRHEQEEAKKYQDLYVERVKLNNEKADIVEAIRTALGRSPPKSMKDIREWATEIRRLRETSAGEYTRLRKTIDDQRSELARARQQADQYRTQAESDYNRVHKLHKAAGERIEMMERTDANNTVRIQQLETDLNGYRTLTGSEPWFDLKKAFLPCHEFIAKCLEYWKTKAKSYAPRPNDVCRCTHTANNHDTLHQSAHARMSVEPRTKCFAYGCWCTNFDLEVK